MRLKPLQDWVLIRRSAPEEKTAGGIIIPEVAKDKPAEGLVEAVGPGRYKTEKEDKKKGKKEKKFVPTVLQPGERVLFVDYMAKDIELGEEKITLIREEDVLGVLETPAAGTSSPHGAGGKKADTPPKAVTKKAGQEKTAAAKSEKGAAHKATAKKTGPKKKA